MNDKTMEEYKRIAARFYAEIEGEVTPKKLTDHLLKKAHEYRPKTWRKLKSALKFDQGRQGFNKTVKRIEQLCDRQNPATAKGKKPHKIKKSKRIERVTDADLDALVQAIQDKEDPLLAAALVLAKELGCRPDEMLWIHALPDGTVFIRGSKVSDVETPQGEFVARGLDRTVQVSAEAHGRITDAVRVIENHPQTVSGTKAIIQSRLNRLTAKIWPRRKHRPSLYSFRHQMGAELKEAVRTGQMDAVEASYVMGHRSTDSINEYGDRRTASGGSGIKPAIDKEMVKDLVRDNAKKPPAVKQRRTRSVSLDRSNDLSL